MLVLSVLPIHPGSALANHLGTDIQVIDVDATDDALITVDVYYPDGNGLLESQVR
jgi:hypothetical protein